MPGVRMTSRGTGLSGQGKPRGCSGLGLPGSARGTPFGPPARQALTSCPSSEARPRPDPVLAWRGGGSPSPPEPPQPVPPPPAHLRVAGGEGGAIDDAALFLGPGLAVRVGGAGVPGGRGVGAGRGELPAVAELQRAAHHGPAPRGEVIARVVVEVPAQPADPALQTRDGSTGGSGHVQEGPESPALPL